MSDDVTRASRFLAYVLRRIFANGLRPGARARVCRSADRGRGPGG